MVTSLDKSENKLQIHHLHLKRSVNSGVNRSSRTFYTIYTRGIIYAVNAHIEVAISHSVSECRSDELGEFAVFPQIWLPWQRPLRYRKKRSRSSFAFGEKIAKIGPVDPEIIVLWAIIKNKKKEINANKIYSPLGRHADWATKSVRRPEW